MEVTKQEMIDYASSLLKRYEREENEDCQLELNFGQPKRIKTDNEKAWKAKQKKILILKAILKELSK